MNVVIPSLALLIIIGWTYQPTGVKEVQLNREFDLKVGQEGLIKAEGLRIEFNSVIEDSRCPAGVTCIWAGNAKISVNLIKGKNRSAAIELNTGLEPTHHAYSGYEVRLVKLNPYPKADENIDKKDYVATLLVCK